MARKECLGSSDGRELGNHLIGRAESDYISPDLSTCGILCESLTYPSPSWTISAKSQTDPSYSNANTGPMGMLKDLKVVLRLLLNCTAA